MGTWEPGVPYTDSDADQITAEVGTDRATTDFAVPQPTVVDNGAAVNSTVAETSLLAGTMEIAANVAQIDDEFEFEAYGVGVNLTGGSSTFRFRFKVGGTTVLDQTYTVNNLAGIQWRLRATLSFEAVGDTSTLHVSGSLEQSNGTAVGNTFAVTAATPLTPATTSAIAIALTTEHGVSGLQNECKRATLRGRLRA